MPPGYFFDVMTNGFGDMSSYATQVPVADRWAIAAYVRALQLAGHAPVSDLPPADRTALADAAARVPARETSTAPAGEEGLAEPGPAKTGAPGLPPPSRGEHRNPGHGPGGGR